MLLRMTVPAAAATAVPPPPRLRAALSRCHELQIQLPLMRRAVCQEVQLLLDPHSGCR